MPASADLVIVSSPLQYLNAVEWRRRRPDRAVDLVLLGDRAGGGAAIDLLMARAPSLWRSVRRCEGRPRSSRKAPKILRDAIDLQHRARLRRLAASLAGGGYAALAFGDYRNRSQRELVDRIAHAELTLLDDGSITPQAARCRAGEPTPDPSRFADRWLRTRLARALFGGDRPIDPPRLTFFTIYGALIEPTLRPGDRVERHAFESWRTDAPARSGDEVWLLGANHVEAGIACFETHRRLIVEGVAALRRVGFHGPVLYRPHRGEDRSAAEALARAAGARFEPSITPVELAYLDAPVKPAAVAVVASSAADTLSVIDPKLPIVRFALPEGYLKRQRDHILAVVRAHDAFIKRLRVIEPCDAPVHRSLAIR
ncbi:hypothetical protein [Methylopila turkensis]|uniref:Uncharacterized protein n=1 Tax=Methylopila turkensis TaxID=1437816 RepID=A0A9W6JRZ0_9HYPH|nr:hypothetical protein [Methylopila turkensis]GLK81318.1 hypothetical protein GCM10008174_30590 [Methylopila turkensis]